MMTDVTTSSGDRRRFPEFDSNQRYDMLITMTALP